MTDIRYLQQLDFPAYAVHLDWLLTDQNLIADGYDLQTAVIIALGTDARAPVSEELPDPNDTDRRGWWGDMDAEELWDKIYRPLADGQYGGLLGEVLARARPQVLRISLNYALLDCSPVVKLPQLVRLNQIEQELISMAYKASEETKTVLKGKP